MDGIEMSEEREQHSIIINPGMNNNKRQIFAVHHTEMPPLQFFCKVQVNPQCLPWAKMM